MENLKIEVNGNIEELVDLFKQLGCKYFNHTGSVLNYMFFENSGVYFCKLKKNFDESECKEITLPQLRDKVVLHRNDVGDANHTDQDDWKWFVASDGKAYVFAAGNAENKQRWDESPLDHVDLKPINKSKSEVSVENLISGKEALIALANGEDVQIESNKQWVSVENCQVYQFLYSNCNYKFRLKPRTIKIGDIDVPAPFEPKGGDKYYHISIRASLGYGWDEWEDSDYDARASIFGAWRTEEEIKQVVAALRELMGVAK